MAALDPDGALGVEVGGVDGEEGCAGAAIVRFTATVCEDGFAPGAEICSVPLYVPAAWPEIFAPTETSRLPVPDAAELVIHGLLADDAQVRVPPPALEM